MQQENELVLGTALPIHGGKNVKKEYECNPIEYNQHYTYEVAPSTVTLNMQTLVGVLDEILNTSNEFLYDSNLVTKEKFKTAILSVMNDSYKNSTWNAFKLPVTIPDVSGDGIT